MRSLSPAGRTRIVSLVFSLSRARRVARLAKSEGAPAEWRACSGPGERSVQRSRASLLVSPRRPTVGARSVGRVMCAHMPLARMLPSLLSAYRCVCAVQATRVSSRCIYISPCLCLVERLVKFVEPLLAKSCILGQALSRSVSSLRDAVWVSGGSCACCSSSRSDCGRRRHVWGFAIPRLQRLSNTSPF